MERFDVQCTIDEAGPPGMRLIPQLLPSDATTMASQILAHSIICARASARAQHTMAMDERRLARERLSGQAFSESATMSLSPKRGME